jgi:hypothetical protein
MTALWLAAICAAFLGGMCVQGIANERRRAEDWQRINTAVRNARLRLFAGPLLPHDPRRHD